MKTENIAVVQNAILEDGLQHRQYCADIVSPNFVRPIELNKDFYSREDSTQLMTFKRHRW